MTERLEDALRYLREELPRRAMRHQVPGVSVAVLAAGETVEATTGVVNLRTGVEVTAGTLFMIQSITKVWTATLVMQLVDDGLVELDRPVRTYLPAFRTADREAGARITVRHLLTHTGGFEGDLWAPTTCGPDALQRFVEDLVSGATQYTRPGERYSYCSSGYGVLGRLVEVLRGTSYEDAVRGRLVKPLGIQEVAFGADQALLFRTAVGHASPGSGAPPRPLQAWALLPASNPAAGNQLAMSARALLAFGRMHLADGVAADGTRVLSASSARMMREWQVAHPALLGPRSGHGLGWALSDPPGVVEHSGDTIGVAALLRLVPEQKVGVVVLTNGGDAYALMSELVDPVLSRLGGLKPPPPLPAAPADAPISEPQRFVGRFENRPNVYEVTLEEGDRLQLAHRRQNEGLALFERAGVPSYPERSELRLLGGTRFCLVDESGTVRQAAEFFDLDPDLGAQVLHISGRTARRVAAAAG